MRGGEGEWRSSIVDEGASVGFVEDLGGMSAGLYPGGLDATGVLCCQGLVDHECSERYTHGFEVQSTSLEKA